MPHPKIQLSTLRDIGWSKWDPIGLSAIEGPWKNSPAADEYDSYLLHVVSLLRQGYAQDECISYLMHVENEHMGLSVKSTGKQRAAETVAAIRVYLAEFPDGPLGVR